MWHGLGYAVDLLHAELFFFQRGLNSHHVLDAAGETAAADDQRSGDHW